MTDGADFKISTDAVLSSTDKHKSVLTITPSGFTKISDLVTTFTCVFTSGDESSSIPGEDTFTLTKLVYGKRIVNGGSREMKLCAY